jgi:hypothetical protein
LKVPNAAERPAQRLGVRLEAKEKDDTDDDQRSQAELVGAEGTPKHDRLEDRREEGQRRKAEHRDRDSRHLDAAVEEQPVKRDKRADSEQAPHARLAEADAAHQQHAAHDQHHRPDPVPDKRQRADRDALSEDRGEPPEEHREVHQRIGAARRKQR